MSDEGCDGAMTVVCAYVEVGAAFALGLCVVIFGSRAEVECRR